MRKLTITILSVLLLLWIAALLLFVGILPHTFLPNAVSRFEFPQSTSALGDSFVIIESFFSTISVTLALIAVLYQGKELKDSTDAQQQQAQALIRQLDSQKKLLVISAHSAHIQALVARLN